MPDESSTPTSHIPARAVWPLTFAISAVMLVVRLAFALSEQLSRGESLTVGLLAFEEVVGSLVAVPYLLVYIQLLRRWPLTASHRTPWILRLTVVYLVGSALHAPLLFALRGGGAALLGIDGYSLVPSAAEWINEAINDFLPAVAITAGLTAAEYLLEARARERRAFALQQSLLQAELRNVRLQLQPHFLFNALNTIAATMYDDPAAADAQLTGLAELLRASLRSTDAQEVPLRDEVALVEQYVRLMQARFPGALAWETSLDVGTGELLVPSMSLQPLVENAVRHGALAHRGAGAVRLTAHVVASGDDGARDGATLVLRVHDDGPGAPPGRDLLASGTGLSATARRLQLLHGTRGTLRAGNAEDGGFEVVMRLPARAAPAGAIPGDGTVRADAIPPGAPALAPLRGVT